MFMLMLFCLLCVVFTPLVLLHGSGPADDPDSRGCPRCVGKLRPCPEGCVARVLYTTPKLLIDDGTRTLSSNTNTVWSLNVRTTQGAWWTSNSSPAVVKMK